MADGPRAGRDLVQLVPVEPSTPRFGVGDPVVLSWSGGDPDDPGSYQVVDFQRSGSLWWLAGLFAAAVLALGRWRGLAALAALGLSFVVLLLFVLPAILAGHNPLWVAVVGACLIMFAVLYLTHGPSARTSTAVLGTLVSLLLIGGLSAAFTALARLTGLDDTTSALIGALGTGVDARGLLLAGVVIGALGVLDDVTVTQTSAVWELHGANPALGARGLFTAAMRIGRDHVSSAVNTLVLAYAGASLPLMLIFSVSGRGLGDVVTTQEVATEIVRTLVGSIGLVASVPITTAVAAVVASREAAPQSAERRPTRLASPFASVVDEHVERSAKAAGSSPGAARHGPGPSSTSDSTVTTSSPPGASDADERRVERGRAEPLHDHDVVGARPRANPASRSWRIHRTGRSAPRCVPAARATGDTSTASTTSPRRASHNATAPRPQATSSARPAVGTQSSRPRNASGGSGTTSSAAACRASHRARSASVTRPLP